jgi:hypothetical protein
MFTLMHMARSTADKAGKPRQPASNSPNLSYDLDTSLSECFTLLATVNIGSDPAVSGSLKTARLFVPYLRSMIALSICRTPRHTHVRPVAAESVQGLAKLP